MITRSAPSLRSGRRLRASRGRSDDPSRLTFSLSVVSGRPIPVLDTFERSWPHHRRGQYAATGMDRTHLYGIGRFTVDEPGWAARADLVDAGISELLDRLEHTGITATELCSSDVFVRAYFTLPPGAETIRADTVERLSGINATIWIDA